MKETNKNKFDPRSFLLRTLVDPVLWYTVLIMTALMYHYRDRDTASDVDGYLFAVGWGAATFVLGWLLFRVFDFMQKHHVLGFLAYSAVGACFGGAAWYIIQRGLEDYPITWGLWFLTPQDSLDYSFLYAAAFYLIFTLFMCSVIYYFTRVRYRIFMNFLIFIIPFAIYGKEYEKMPTLFIILLAVGYILLMVYYRQLKDSEDTVFIGRRKSWKTIAVYAVVFAAAAALFPKPYIEADRTTLETLMNNEIITDKLNNMLNVFRDTTGGDRFRTNLRSVDVYESVSPDDLHLKMGTYSTYDYDTDKWSTSDIDLYYREKVTASALDIGSPMGLADAVLEAASLDEEYAERYGLTEYAEEGLDEPELREVMIYTTVGASGLSEAYDMAPVPQNAVRLSDCSRRREITSLSGGLVVSVGSNFDNAERFRFEYSADTFFNSAKNRKFIENIAENDYRQFLADTKDVLESNLTEYELENDQAYSYFRNEYVYYDDFCDVLLDYGGNTRIKELADELTEGFDSEYEKALVLESYFYDNDYIYDLSYVKESGENAEDFLFETKTGVCYEYATAMVLLARAAGIPARYCEGYNMNRREEGIFIKSADHIVLNKDAHGFPQLYIKGYGWVDFEPTVTDEVVENKNISATNMLSRAGLVILAGGLLVLLFALLYPRLSHRLFIMSSKKRKPGELVRAAMLRICRIYDIEGVNTSKEAAAAVREASGADISLISELFDRAVYGGEVLDEGQKENILKEYTEAYEAFREAKKRKGITNRQKA